MTKLFISTLGLLSILFFISPTPASAQSGDTVCQATTDLNQDGASLSVADFVAFMRLLADSTAQMPWYTVDINADCVVDTADLHLLHDYLIYGLSVLIPNPGLGLYTCCDPEVRWVCCDYRRGNVNGDSAEAVNIIDVTYLVKHLFQGGAPPLCRDEGNVNGDANGSINVVDVTFLVRYLFNGGAEPPECIIWPPWP
jgi:hypothetical protein